MGINYTVTDTLLLGILSPVALIALTLYSSFIPVPDKGMLGQVVWLVNFASFPSLADERRNLSSVSSAKEEPNRLT
jgi:hypothetical protein